MRNRVCHIGALAWCSFILGLVACTSNSGDGTVAGSSMETENSIAVTVQLANGAPAARTKVLVRPKAFLAGTNAVDSSVIIDAETDSLGVLSMETMRAGSYIVEARNGDLKGFAKIDIDESDTGLIELPVQVLKPGSVVGQVLKPENVESVSVGVQGLDYVVQTDSAGTFKFESLPTGDLDVVAFIYIDTTIVDENGWSSHVNDMKTVGTMSVEVKSEKTADELVLGTPEPTYVMFEDFESGVSGWYPSVSRYATATLSYEKAGQGRDGMAAHFSSINDSLNNWALMGFAFNEPKDFSSMDSIVFWARGNDRISVSFDVIADSSHVLGDGKSWTHIELDTVWTRYCVTPDDMLEVDSIGGNIGWDAVKKNITNLSFFSGPDTAEFWLDDIEIFGIKRSKLK